MKSTMQETEQKEIRPMQDDGSTTSNTENTPLPRQRFSLSTTQTTQPKYHMKNQITSMGPQEWPEFPEYCPPASLPMEPLTITRFWHWILEIKVMAKWHSHIMYTCGEHNRVACIIIYTQSCGEQDYSYCLNNSFSINSSRIYMIRDPPKNWIPSQVICSWVLLNVSTGQIMKQSHFLPVGEVQTKSGSLLLITFTHCVF